MKIQPILILRIHSISRIGFAWSVRVIGFIALGTLLLPIALMKMRFKPPKARALIDWAAFTDAPYMIFTFATFIGFIVRRCPFYFTILISSPPQNAFPKPILTRQIGPLRDSLLSLFLCPTTRGYRYADGVLPCPYLQRCIVFRPYAP